MYISDCCGAEASDPVMLDVGICPDCHEHCEFLDDEKDEEIATASISDT